MGTMGWMWKPHGDNMEHEDNVKTTWGQHGDHGDVETTWEQWRPHGDNMETTWGQHEDNVETTWGQHGDNVDQHGDVETTWTT